MSSRRKRSDGEMGSEGVKDRLQEDQVLPARLPSLSRILALNSKQPPTVSSDTAGEGLWSSALWGQRRARTG